MTGHTLVVLIEKISIGKTIFSSPLEMMFQKSVRHSASADD